ncbi:MATE family efflux transporter [Legionella sp.]|uniref:MATE family efflux transporter n=1 Tax=Legionella sp. TaxID=459 RepID=UPI0039E2F412
MYDNLWKFIIFPLGNCWIRLCPVYSHYAYPYNVNVIFFLKGEYREYHFFKKRDRNNFSNLKRIFSLGWPILLHAISDYLAGFCLILLIGKLGTSELIAQQISSQYTQLLTVLILGISQASNLLISGRISLNKYEEIKDIGYISIFLGVILGLTAIILFSFFADLFIYPYSNNISLVTISLLKPFLVFTMFNLLLSAVRSICIGMLRAFYDTKIPMIIGILCG